MNKENHINVNKHFATEEIDLLKFKNKTSDEQINIINDILSSAYPSTEILNSWILSCIELANQNNNDYIKLPKKLIVQKKSNKLIFKFKNKKMFLIIILFILAFALSAGGASLYTLHKLNLKDQNNNLQLNIDIDGDGIPDLNIDTDGDGNPDVNIDTNNDGKPDLNVDYKGNRQPIFNLDKNKTGKPNFNLVNKGNSCTVNCDTNNDGWPDINIDIDGDGKPDLDIDTDGDGKPDLNIDADGDKKCDLNCDTNNDGVCDLYCSNKDDKQNNNQNNTSNSNNNNNNNYNSSNTNNNNSNNNNTTIKPSGPSGVTGEPSTVITEKDLIITYIGNYSAINNVLPNDMENATPLPDRYFTIENTSKRSLTYRLVWKISKNEFKTNNLKYKLVSSDTGTNIDYTEMPKNNTTIIENITIPAKTIQSFTVSFVFEGTNSEQNVDKNKEFRGYITAEYEERQ